MFTVDIEFVPDKVDINPLEKIAKNVVEQYRKLLNGAEVRYEIKNNQLDIILEKKGDVQKKIPYKILNGKIVVPKEYQKYVSKDGKKLNINEASDYSKIIEQIDLDIL